MAVDRARLADEALSLRTLAFGPDRARLVDAGSTAGHTVEVLVGGGVIVDETGRVRDEDVLDIVVLVEVELVELAERVGRGGDEGRGVGDWRLVSQFLGDS